MPDPTSTIVDESPAALLRFCPAYAPTPLTALPRLAAALGVAGVLVKDEGRRPLGSFKALGGVYAGLRALARAAAVPTASLLDKGREARPLPALVCASDGNHGLAVAAAARLAATQAQVFLPDIVPAARAARIAAQGAEIVRVAGTYDEAVRAAARAARERGDLLIADTSADEGDPVVGDIMAGYRIIADEVRAQIVGGAHAAPTHLFVQAGVGGFAAALAVGLEAALAPPARIVAVEPVGAACVGAALAARRVVALAGDLRTSAEMLSCGEASAPALTILLRHGAEAVAAPEAYLRAAPDFLAAHGGPRTTPSGAAGLAGLRLARAEPALAERLSLNETSRVLLIATEASSPDLEPSRV